MNQGEKSSILAGLYGNALEWYDFLLYASFAPIFAELYFPANVHFVSLMATYSVFAIGFFMRPIGGLLLGHYADHAGRRKALILSVVVMTVSTSCIAFLPGYQYAGVLAPILFVFFRLVQGLAVGGELPGSATFLIEHMFAHRRGFAGSLVLCTAFLGIFAGSFTASMLSHFLSPEYLSQWGWRFAYILGGILGIVGIYLRVNSVESPKFLKTKPTHELPAKIVFMQYTKPLILAIIFTSIMALGNYILIAYVTTFLVKSEGFILRDALLINFIALLLLTVLIPIMGYLSDYVGRKPLFLLGLFSLLLLTFPFFWLLLSGNWNYILLSELLLSVALAPLNAIVPTIIAEMFPTEVRASGSSIGYNIGQALFGGTVPVIALTLVEVTKNKYAPAWYIFLACLIALIIAIKFLSESFRKKFI